MERVGPGAEGAPAASLRLDGNASSEPLALVFPGLRYGPERPVLHFTHRWLRRRGWAVAEVDYGFTPEAFTSAGEGEREDWIAAAAATAWARARSEGTPRLLVGKSLGALALAWLLERAKVPKVWLTPLLRSDDVAAALARDAQPGLLVADEADPATPPEALRGLARPGLHTLVLPRAGHDLESEDPLTSLDLLKDYLLALTAFVEGV
ncbi:alpha/beta fold hydrolase [Oceanithermus sp.]